jgi:hypothetical protein
MLMYVEVYELSHGRKVNLSVYVGLKIYIPTLVLQGITIQLNMMMEMNIDS